MPFLPPELNNYAWIMTTYVLAVTTIVFLSLWILEWLVRAKQEKEHDSEMAKLITDYEHRQILLEKKTLHNTEFIDLLMSKNPLIGEEVKKILLQDFKEKSQ